MDPSNTSALISLKKACANFPGLSEIILVIGEEKKAMRMPFKCDPEQKLVEELRNYFGPEGVVVKWGYFAPFTLSEITEDIYPA